MSNKYCVNLKDWTGYEGNKDLLIKRTPVLSGVLCERIYFNMKKEILGGMVFMY